MSLIAGQFGPKALAMTQVTDGRKRLVGCPRGTRTAALSLPGGHIDTTRASVEVIAEQQRCRPPGAENSQR
ncbi:hypothetical protein MXEN_06158 [Mycobacterium xenopi RIVM700367]|nr:hypothetical protein MXEN_06158 [Mycobacterium xenopi RIVM700367]